MAKYRIPNVRAVIGVPAAVMSLAVPFTAHEEGTRTKAYLDSANIPTICVGETEGVRMGDESTVQECSKLFYARLGFFAWQMDQYIHVPMAPEFHAAVTSWSYNVGLGAAKASTLVKKANADDMRGACNELPRWKYSAGKPILAERRERERVLCLKGTD